MKEALETLKDEPGCDFGKHIIPYCHNKGERLFAYEYNGYWKDVGTLGSYWEANMELIDIIPEFNLYEEFWKIYTKGDIIPPQYISADAVTDRLKPHGALYNMAAKDYDLSKAICEAIYEYDKDLIVMGLSGSEMIKAAKDCGLKSASEVFADRAYEEDGTLVNRRKPGAMIEDEDEAINRVIRMIKEGKVTSITGKDIDIKADSVCVHGDGEKALLFVEKIRKTFVENEIEICHL